MSVDELMGYSKEKTERDILDTIAEYHRLARSYQGTREFITEAYKRYPNDYRIMNLYMWDIVSLADCKDDVLNEHSDELHGICRKILDGCSDAKIVLDAKNMQIKLLKAGGKTEEAIALYKREFPNFLQDSYQKIEQLFEKNTDEYRYWNKMNTYRYLDFAAMKCARMYWYEDKLSVAEKVEKCERCMEQLSRARKETGESFFVVFEKSLIEQFIYLMAAHDGDVADIARLLDKFLAAACAETEMLQVDPVLRDGVAVPYKTDNTLAYHVANWRTSNHWSIARLRDKEEIKAVLDRYEALLEA